jgi:hypothetical protein
MPQRLRKAADAAGGSGPDIIPHYGLERFLYRLSESSYSDRFVLTGALMLAVWQGSQSRPTRDMDVQGRIVNSLEAVLEAIRDICTQEVEADGVAFDPATVEADTVVEDGVRQGVRAEFWGRLGNVRLRRQVDVGCGDPVVAPPAAQPYPTILDPPAPVRLGYSAESAIAEKFEAMVKLGLLNGRLKDYHDVWLLSRRFDVRGEGLSEAVRRTFDFRGTALVAEPEGLTPRYAEQAGYQRLWRDFLDRHDLADVSLGLDGVIAAASPFLLPVAQALLAGAAWTQVWHAPGPWRPE